MVCINTLCLSSNAHLLSHVGERTCVHHRLIISIWWQVETRMPYRTTCSRIYYQLYVTTTTNLTKLLPNSILLNSLNELRAKLIISPTIILEMSSNRYIMRIQCYFSYCMFWSIDEFQKYSCYRYQKFEDSNLDCIFIDLIAAKLHLWDCSTLCFNKSSSFLNYCPVLREK